jgi:hypothetical protein
MFVFEAKILTASCLVRVFTRAMLITSSISFMYFRIIARRWRILFAVCVFDYLFVLRGVDAFFLMGNGMSRDFVVVVGNQFDSRLVPADGRD